MQDQRAMLQEWASKYVDIASNYAATAEANPEGIRGEKEHYFLPSEIEYGNLLLDQMRLGQYLSPDQVHFLKLRLPSSHPIHWEMVLTPWAAIKTMVEKLLGYG